MIRLSFATLLVASTLSAQEVAEPRRLEVLFLGDDGHHNPIERYRVLKQSLGPQGFNLSFEEDLSEITSETLSLYDALIVYANYEKEEVPAAIQPWVTAGGGLVALHSACGNFHPSEEWFDLVGGRFASHEGGVFSPVTVDSEHPITKDLPVLKSWDETYQHQDLTEDRHLLQVREPMNEGESEPEPWTWVRKEGEGRVFYTASGHDLRSWREPAYQELVRRAIVWSVGDEKADLFARFELPKLETEVPELDNRTHPDIPMMELQKPLSPEDSAAHTQVPVRTRLELFASEPMIKNPIAIDWDHRGRAWVVESFGYPNDVPEEPGSGTDTIKILEDSDGDGRADKMTVFAEGLRHCTATAFVKDGVLATDGRDFVFLGDSDGDDKADVRQVLATGLNINDTHASTSNLFRGIDNWIYATVGYSGVDMKVGDQHHKFGSSVFRVRPDLSELEFLQGTTNNTWGLGFTEQGDITGSTANNNPSWLVSIPARAYHESGLEQPRTPRMDVFRRRDGDRGPRLLPMYTNTRDVTQVDQIDGYTAAAGHQFYTDRVMDEILAPNNVLICEPTGHLVATGDVVAKGSLMETILRGKNIFASADAWAAPVAARVGPDGAVWIADWYNPIIQHNVVFRYYNPARNYDQPHSPYHTGERKGPGKGNAYRTPLRDRDHGRIWRVVPADGKLREDVTLDPRRVNTLLAGLRSPSQLIRLEAQRLLVESGSKVVVAELTKMVKQGSQSEIPALHALWTLEGLGEREALVPALSSSSALLRRHALLALGAKDPAVVSALPQLIAQTEEPRELLHVLTAAAQTEPHEKVAQALWNRVQEDADFDDSLREASRLALRQQGLTLVKTSLADLPAVQPNHWQGQEAVEVIKRVASSDQREDLANFAKEAPVGVRTHIESILAGPRVVEREAAQVPRRFHAGRDHYMKACIECHQADGKGVENTFPPLVDSEWVTGDRDRMLRILLGGLAGEIEVNGIEFNGVMPGHSHVSDEEIAQIASFVRFAFGGLEEEAVTPAEVKALRPEVEARKYVPWSVEDLEKAGQ
ncbi:PVC-type heme-binding CxxCH protein [Roseibacillus ishigakijimensis]|uniref:ThuA domain-containing protein n=1 Tax=Roseibacillus ishigakijimensis TaxID=454146 RepID=A0A934RNT4_9BACT|nr:PVC-type heme-binding CxxCH protein [Roseibacillus ishigakijimensis]MBK1832738.1 ThuA domain-containing protein [Roseibacillus ishigakijimensis]